MFQHGATDLSWTMLWHRNLATGLTSQRPGFNPSPSHVGFVTQEWHKNLGLPAINGTLSLALIYIWAPPINKLFAISSSSSFLLLLFLLLLLLLLLWFQPWLPHFTSYIVYMFSTAVSVNTASAIISLSLLGYIWSFYPSHIEIFF